MSFIRPCRGAAAFALGALALGASVPGHAQTASARPLRLIVPFPAGGPVDIMGRAVAAFLYPGGTPPVIVDNRGGAGGNIGVEVAAKSPPDGQTMVISIVSTLAISAALYPKLSYDPVRDLAPLIGVGSFPGVIVVHPALPVKDVKELVALAKRYPGELNYGSAGIGTSAHLGGELFRMMTGANIAHVPYKGNAPAMQDLLGGRLQLMFDYLPASLPFIRSGRIRPLAVGGTHRSRQLPDIPTVRESGVKDYVLIGQFGMFVPAGTPAEVVRRLSADMNTMLGRADYRERLTALGADVPAPNTSAELEAMLKAEMAIWAKVVKQAGVRID